MEYINKKHNFDGIHFMRFLGPFNNNVEIEWNRWLYKF